MSVIENTTGHSRAKEKSIARILFMALAAAIIVGVAVAFLAGRSNSSLDPKASDNTQQVAPDLGAPPPVQAPATEPAH